MSEIRMSITGPDDLMASALDSFVRQHGWDETSDLKPISYARQVLRGFIMESVTAKNVVTAVEFARLQASTQTTSALDLTTMVVEEI